MKQMRKLHALLLALLLTVSMLAVPGKVQAATKKTALNKTKVTLEVGDSVKLKLKNAPKGKTVKWSSSKKAVASVSKKGKVTAKNAGVAKVKAAVSGKKYTCTVTVKKKDVAEEPAAKNAAELKALEAIIEAQNALGVDVSAASDEESYGWNDDGNLVAIGWRKCGLKGSLSFEAFPFLERLDLAGNELTDLDISSNPALEIVYCGENQLTSLDVSKNPALKGLYCGQNQLTSLDLSKNPLLDSLYCFENQLTSLDISNNPELVWLDCQKNPLTSLDITNNPLLFGIECDSTLTIIEGSDR